jgi:hypothetical protein
MLKLACADSTTTAKQGVIRLHTPICTADKRFNQQQPVVYSPVPLEPSVSGAISPHHLTVYTPLALQLRHWHCKQDTAITDTTDAAKLDGHIHKGPLLVMSRCCWRGAPHSSCSLCCCTWRCGSLPRPVGPLLPGAGLKLPMQTAGAAQHACWQPLPAAVLAAAAVSAASSAVH